MKYSIPNKIERMLWEDDEFYNMVAKIGRVQSGRFPKIDQYATEDGFNMSFALAGYAPEDIELSVTDRVITILSNGIENAPIEPVIMEDDDAMEEYVRPKSVGVHKGMISRGIARRSFKVSFVIRDIFDVYGTSATMEHGLLKVVIPLKDAVAPKVVEITEKS